MRFRLFIGTLLLASLACQTIMGPVATPRLPPPPPPPTRVPLPTNAPPPTPQLGVTAAPQPTQSSGPVFDANGVRQCDYVPGVSVPAQMPPDLAALPTPPPAPTATPPPVSSVSKATTDRQLRIYRQLWDTVNDTYVYEDFRGRDWNAIGDRYEGYIRGGLTDEDFYLAMADMINELGDDHSHFIDPEQAAKDDRELAGTVDYVGIGVLLSAVPSANRAVVITVFEGSPALEAGVRSHDAILRVDGEPILDEAGVLQTGKVRGPEGTEVTLTFQRAGGEPFDITFTRRRIQSPMPIDYCLVPGTRLGYIFLPGMSDETIVDRFRSALEQMTLAGPLAGLIIDNRQNGGGSSSVADPLMGMFTEGLQGYFFNRTDRIPLELEAEDVGGSQTVPLVILVDVDTVSYGEIMSGVLRVAGRAVIVGQTTYGNVERLYGTDFEDGSRAWIASETFEPNGETNGVWEETGIVPDHLVPTRWDLFTEATDPALAKAVELLSP